MFIHCKKTMELREGEQTLLLPAGFVGEIPGWAAEHWFIRAAISDGTIIASGSTEKKGRRAEAGA